MRKKLGIGLLLAIGVGTLNIGNASAIGWDTGLTYAGPAAISALVTERILSHPANRSSEGSAGWAGGALAFNLAVNAATLVGNVDPRVSGAISALAMILPPALALYHTLSHKVENTINTVIEKIHIPKNTYGDRKKLTESLTNFSEKASSTWQKTLKNQRIQEINKKLKDTNTFDKIKDLLNNPDAFSPDKRKKWVNIGVDCIEAISKDDFKEKKSGVHPKKQTHGVEKGVPEKKDGSKLRGKPLKGGNLGIE